MPSARLRGTVDWLVRAYNGLILAVPNFVVATLIVLLLPDSISRSSRSSATRPSSTDPARQHRSLLLPALSLALAVSVTISENTRAAVLEVSSQDFVMVARAKGLLPRTILRNYLVRNALTPVITVTGLQIASLLGGSILVETIFAIPGMGQYLFEFDQQPRLSGDPGHRPRRCDGRHSRQHARRHRLCPRRREGQAMSDGIEAALVPATRPASPAPRRLRPTNGQVLLGLGLAMLALVLIVTVFAPLIAPLRSFRDLAQFACRTDRAALARHRLDRPRRAEPSDRRWADDAADHGRRPCRSRLPLDSCSACSRAISAAWSTTIIMRVLDVVFAFPVFLLADRCRRGARADGAEPDPHHRHRLHAAPWRGSCAAPCSA